MFGTRVLKRAGCKSLVWQGDELVDWAARAATDEPLDSAVATPDGEWAVAFHSRGTRGIVFHDGDPVRELMRAGYHADVYMYPIALWRDANGRALLAHCPGDYHEIEIEDLATGEALTSSDDRNPTDYFQSRLQVSPNRRWLLTAGWVWHPWDAIAWFDLEQSLVEASTLDDFDEPPQFSSVLGDVEMSFATFREDSTLLVGTSGEPGFDDETERTAPSLQPSGIGTYDIEIDQWLEFLPLRHPPGWLMPVGTTHFVSFFEHPRLYRISDGSLLHAWTDIPTGSFMSSIVGGRAELPVMAIDSENGRFAVAQADRITVVELDPIWFG